MTRLTKRMRPLDSRRPGRANVRRAIGKAGTVVREAGAWRRWVAMVSGARPEEAGAALSLFALNFLVITSYMIVKPVRNSLFLDHLGAANLPWAYIGTALFVGVAVWLYFRLLDRLGRTQVIATTWCLLGTGMIAFWYGFAAQGVVASALFYFFSAVYSVMGVTQFWSFCSEVLDARQARRMYGFIGAGAIAGGLMGSLITGILAERLGTEQLLFVAAALCFVCAVLGATLSVVLDRPSPDRRTEAVEADTNEKEGFEDAKGGLGLLLTDRYLLRIVGIIFSLQMISTLVDFSFSQIAEAAYPLKDARTAFFGKFFVCLNTTSLLVQLVVTRWVHRNLGLGPALAAMPLATLVTGTAFALFPAFLAGCLLKLANGALDYSIDRASRELLYLPTSREVKYKVKAFVDMFCFRFFRCLAGLLILAVGWASRDPLPWLGFSIVVVAAGWLGIARSARSEYLGRIRETLLAARATPAPAGAPLPVAGIPTLSEAEGRIELGWELSRQVHSLEVAIASPEAWSEARTWALDRSRNRILDLLGRLSPGPDVELCRGALSGSETRPLALELLDGVAGDALGRLGRLTVRVLDPDQTPDERLACARLALDQLGELPARERPRLVWPASLAVAP